VEEVGLIVSQTCKKKIYEAIFFQICTYTKTALLLLYLAQF
jgi:hypothetical protein